MTEAEWLAATDPSPKLEFMRGKASVRKLRLFACGCCRRLWDVLVDQRSRQAVLVAEKYADELATQEELACAEQAAGVAASEAPGGLSWFAAIAAKMTAANRLPVQHVLTRTPPMSQYMLPVATEERNRQCVLVLDIFGNPFRPVVADPSWLTSTVRALATGIYEDRAFDRLPILADALQDAGCDSDDILNHCRQPGEHVRGCWVVDLVLRRK